MDKTRFCQTCQVAKDETPENFQRRGDSYRTPCRLCMKKARERRHKVETPEEEFRVVGHVKINHEPQESALGSAIDAIYQKHQRFFTFQVAKNKVILDFHGAPHVSYRGTADEVIQAALK